MKSVNREQRSGVSAVPALQLLGAAVCRVEGCDDLAYPGDDVCLRCREEIDALTDALLRNRWKPPADPVKQSERDAWIRQCIAVFLFVLAGEGITSFALDLPFTWAWLLVQIGWALVVAVVTAWIGGREGRS